MSLAAIVQSALIEQELKRLAVPIHRGSLLQFRVLLQDWLRYPLILAPIENERIAALDDRVRQICTVCK
jgi:hypothetical protein